mmetsp:Transcript_44927/g.118928  ORF Transcript_44927/g.118928 Transcript_44927/m.118928 type:complete len:235 (-) Transcript_44927:2472-3176(-)
MAKCSLSMNCENSSRIASMWRPGWCLLPTSNGEASNAKGPMRRRASGTSCTPSPHSSRTTSELRASGTFPVDGEADATADWNTPTSLQPLQARGGAARDEGDGEAVAGASAPLLPTREAATGAARDNVPFSRSSTSRLSNEVKASEPPYAAPRAPTSPPSLLVMPGEAGGEDFAHFGTGGDNSLQFHSTFAFDVSTTSVACLRRLSSSCSSAGANCFSVSSLLGDWCNISNKSS